MLIKEEDQKNAAPESSCYSADRYGENSGFFIAFIIAVKSGQYDDSYTPSVRMLFEDELVKPQTEQSTQTKTD